MAKIKDNAVTISDADQQAVYAALQATLFLGTTWAEAEIQEPVLPRMLSRFRIPWRWNGVPSVLQSRATDETGRVQPTREALLAARGRLKRPGTYHFNGIQSWGVLPDGEVRHVYA